MTSDTVPELTEGTLAASSIIKSDRPSLADTRGAGGDTVFRFALYGAAALVLIVIGAIMVQLFFGGLPAILAFGFNFFISTDWDPVNDQYGAGVMLYGTLVTSVLALLFAVPSSLGIAFFLTEVAPIPTRKPIGIAVQLLAAVPSIIYGMWGFFVVAPIMKDFVQPLLINGLSWLPVIGYLFSGPAKGTGIFTTSLILALMILPFMTSMYVEVLESVPGVIKEASYGVGSTTWEVFTTVSVPYGRTAIIGATMLGLGRALGETMAVAFVVGNAARISTSLFASGATISSQLANNFNESLPGSLLQASLLELGFTLFVISFLVLALARYLVRSRLQG